MIKKPILVGRFGAAHGIKGELRLKSFTDDPAAIASYGPLFDRTGKRQFTIEALRLVRDDLFTVKIAGIHDRSAAEALTNVELYVPHASLPEPAADEFYRADLIGLAALDGTGATVGHITDVLDFGGGDILEIAPEGGGETLLLPFTKGFVPVVDLASGRITIVRPIEVEDKPDPGAARPSDRSRPSQGRKPRGTAKGR